MDTETIEAEDLLNCVREGRKPRDRGPYKVLIGDRDLNFTDAVIEDPVPTGRQVIESMGIRKADEHLVFQILRNGELEELRLEETVDLRNAEVERFLVFSSSESFHFVIDGKRLEWGSKVISGRVLKRLAGVNPAKLVVWQIHPGRDDDPIEDTDLVRLSGEGLERFFTGKPKTTEGSASLLPRNDRHYLDDRRIAYREVEDGNNKGVILSGITLPEGKYQVEVADILILLPQSYPEVAPDMFYALPHLNLQATGSEPRATTERLTFDGKNWQRWSRHNEEWRSGTDGIWTMIKRVELALEVAA